jgi:hypothetical protein
LESLEFLHHPYSFYSFGTMKFSLRGVAAAAATLLAAVKSPYFNTWQFAGSDGGNGGYLAGQWPAFWQ